MDMKKLLAQAQAVQKKIANFKKEEFSFTKSDNLIKLVMNGNREIINMDIKELVQQVGDDHEMMSDLLKVAINDALKKIDEKEKSIAGNFK